jgi:hypothetical protein
MRNFVFGTAIAIGVSTGVLTGGSAEAQSSLSTGCTAVSGGALNQSVGPGGSGITAVLVESFAAGETITVTITNASNSLFDISGTTTLFSGEVGTLTRSYVFLFAATFTLLSDIQAAASVGATISATCSGTSTPPPSTPTPTPTPATPSDTDAAVNSGMDAIDAGRPSTGPNELPSWQQKNNRLVKLRDRIAVVEENLEENDKERAKRLERIEVRYPKDLGIDPESIAFQRAIAEYVFFIDQQGFRPSFETVEKAKTKVGNILRKLATDAAASGRTKNSPEKIEELITGFLLNLEVIGVINGAEKALNARLSDLKIEARIEAENQGVSSRSAVDFTGSTDRNLRFSSKNIDLGGNGSTQLWLDGQYSILSGSADRDGHVASVRVGLVQTVNPNIDLGFYVSYLSAQTTQTGPGSEIESEGIGFGAYSKFEFSNGVVGGVSVFHEESDNVSIIGGATGHFNRSYTSFEASIEHSYLVSGWRITPAFTVGSVTSARSGFTDNTGAVVSALTETYSTATAEVDFVRTFGVDWNSVEEVTVFGGLAANYHDQTDRVFANGTVISNGGTSGSIDAGATLFMNGGGAFRFQIGTSGLGTDTRATTASVGYRKSF